MSLGNRLGLGHVMSLGNRLGPTLAGVCSTLRVEVSVVGELSGLSDVLLVKSVLLCLVVSADLIVFFSRKSSRNVRVASDLSLGELLSVTGSVVIGVLYGGPEVHVGDLAENRFIQGSARPGNRGGGGKGGSRSNTSSENNSSNLHLYYFAKTRT